jgi:hypothetical protein
MAIQDWPGRWEALKVACGERRATGRWAKGQAHPATFDIAPPAKELDIFAVENQIGFRFPESFRNVLLKYSAAVRIEWELPEKIDLPGEFRDIFAGECRWNLVDLPSLQAEHCNWITKCFSNPNDPYDRVWHNKFPILEIGNGDMLGIELGTPDNQAVVYLSHEDSFIHGYRLGRDFEDYLDRLSLLGCVGSEDWQFYPFLFDPDAKEYPFVRNSMLQTQSEKAKKWRSWFGLHFSETD